MNNFTPRAQQVLQLARKEADRFNHNYVGTEHLLLGLIKLGQGVAVNVLQKMGLDLETVRMEVEKQVGSGPETKIVGNLPYTARAAELEKLGELAESALRRALEDKPALEVALCRSYHRWMDEVWQQGGGRLRWVAPMPLLSMEETLKMPEVTLKLRTKPFMPSSVSCWEKSSRRAMP